MDTVTVVMDTVDTDTRTVDTGRAPMVDMDMAGDMGTEGDMGMVAVMGTVVATIKMWSGHECVKG